MAEIDKNALDRHITGNWGEDQFIDPEQDTPEPRKVYISTGDDSEWLVLWDAITGEQLSTRPEKYRHNLIELATANDWVVVDGPLETIDSDDWSENEPRGDDPGFDPMFLM